VYEELKKHESTRDIPVIMLTARAVIRSTPKSFFYGLYGFLAKPFRRWRLVQMVREIIDLIRKEGAKQTREIILTATAPADEGEVVDE
jgi:DNA-binding NtrC family response regulator